QYLAAVTTEGPVMIIASAGAGKTKTLIHRCATMLVKGISPKNIMVVTFTSKAAKEIKQRLEEMPEIGANAEYICAGTFHGIIFKEILTKF
ncbi:UvrD-helicase domain-containing protein, partial [Vibrio parahaemolyticus]